MSHAEVGNYCVSDLSPETPGTVGGLPVSLTREEDLKPKMNDLDNIFDTDSESSDPEPVSFPANTSCL